MARDNIARFHGDAPNWELVVAEAADALPDLRADRVILDLPEPGVLVGAAAQALRPGGILTCYVPTTIQIDQIGQALRADPAMPWSKHSKPCGVHGTLHRTPVRPDHRMVAHTGFILTALRLADEA